MHSQIVFTRINIPSLLKKMLILSSNSLVTCNQPGWFLSAAYSWKSIIYLQTSSQQARDLVTCVKGDPLTLCRCARAWGQRCGARRRRRTIHMWRQVAWIALQTRSLRKTNHFVRIETWRCIEVILKILVLWKQGQGEPSYECEVKFWEVLLQVDLNPDLLSVRLTFAGFLSSWLLTMNNCQYSAL